MTVLEHSRADDGPFEAAVASMFERDESLRAAATAFWSDVPADPATAWMIGPNGAARVKVLLGDRSLVFVRMEPFGGYDPRARMRPYVLAISDILDLHIADPTEQGYELSLREPGRESSRQRTQVLFGVDNRHGDRLVRLLAKAIRDLLVARNTDAWRQRGWIDEDECADWSAPECTSDGNGYPVRYVAEHLWLCSDKLLRIMRTEHDDQGRAHAYRRHLDLRLDDPTWHLDYSYFGMVKSIEITRAGELLYEGSTYAPEEYVRSALMGIHARRSSTGAPPRDLFRDSRHP
jgi:hypothetical protein